MFLWVNSTNHELMLMSKLHKIREKYSSALSSKGVIYITPHNTNHWYYWRWGGKKSVNGEAVSICGKTVFTGCGRAIVTRNSQQLWRNKSDFHKIKPVQITSINVEKNDKSVSSWETICNWRFLGKKSELSSGI